MVLPSRQLSQHSLIPLAALSLALMGLAACDFQKNKEISGSQGQYDSSQLFFQFVYDRVIGPRCTRCHGSDGGVNLETYEQVVARLERVRVRALVQRDMP